MRSTCEVGEQWGAMLLSGVDGGKAASQKEHGTGTPGPGSEPDS